ncbi:hypothetical protein SAMN05444004_104139 [Jannaschia faecimaris]|uniref:Uncharacterized protein n=1 Tax=Jannaschia faecimaris TaxID=1244108 RepID=A0A1H3NWA1_9RHOB|nr:hypothetical protein [Jannaschia faecimaris]SDY93177.1 hypothetical protein SAMN05444004_104139 [Jannaschia faecimaris]
MSYRAIALFLDSLAIGVAVSTFILAAGVIFDVWGLARAVDELGLIALSVLWLQLAVFIAPFATLALLARMSD